MFGAGNQNFTWIAEFLSFWLCHNGLWGCIGGKLNVHNRFKMLATNPSSFLDPRRPKVWIRFTHGEWLTWPSWTSFTILVSLLYYSSWVIVNIIITVIWLPRSLSTLSYTWTSDPLTLLLIAALKKREEICFLAALIPSCPERAFIILSGLAPRQVLATVWAGIPAGWCVA